MGPHCPFSIITKVALLSSSQWEMSEKEMAIFRPGPYKPPKKFFIPLPFCLDANEHSNFSFLP